MARQMVVLALIFIAASAVVISAQSPSSAPATSPSKPSSVPNAAPFKAPSKPSATPNASPATSPSKPTAAPTEAPVPSDTSAAPEGELSSPPFPVEADTPSPSPTAADGVAPSPSETADTPTGGTATLKISAAIGASAAAAGFFFL